MIEEPPKISESVAFIDSLQTPAVPIPQKEITESEIDVSYEDCIICGAELFPDTKVSIGECDHIYCADCVHDHLLVRISEKKVEKITCPAFMCQTEMSDRQLRTFLSPSEFAKLQRFQKEISLEQNPDLRWCPKIDCPGYDIGGVNKRKLVCTECHLAYCFYCLEAWHPSGKCKAELDRKLDIWAKEHHAKFCPRCRARIEKQLGCNHMTCTRCHYEFCWLCGALWRPIHLETCPVTALKKRNPPWYICLAILFLPIVLPLFFEIFVIYCIQKYLEENDSGCFYRFLKKWWLSYPLLLLLGLVLTPFAASAVILFTLAGIGIHWGRYVRYDSGSCLKPLAQHACLWAFLSILFSILLSPVVVLCIAFAMVVGPLVGVLLFSFKLLITCIRCCCRKDYMKPQGIAGFPAG